MACNSVCLEGEFNENDSKALYIKRVIYDGVVIVYWFTGLQSARLLDV